jgi:hypothetical protein
MPGATTDLQRIKQSESARANAFKLTNGIVLTIKQVPPSLYIDIMTKSSEGRPKPPVMFIERLGRTEENPADPDYQEALKNFSVRQIKAISDAFLLHGTSLLECPAGIEGPDTDGDWIENIIASGLPMPRNKRERYLFWLKVVALVDEKDYVAVMEEVGKKSGVNEAQVAKATQSFRPGEEPDPTG